MAEPAPTSIIPCMNLTVAATGVYRFKVQGYSATKEMAIQTDQHYESDAFTVGGYNWAVRYYPDDGTHSHVGVCLVLRQEGDNGKVAVCFACTPLGMYGEPSVEMEQASSKIADLCGDDNEVEVIRNFIGYKDLEKFVVGDSFVVQCSVSVLKRAKCHGDHQ